MDFYALFHFFGLQTGMDEGQKLPLGLASVHKVRVSISCFVKGRVTAMKIRYTVERRFALVADESSCVMPCAWLMLNSFELLTLSAKYYVPTYVFPKPQAIVLLDQM